MSATKTLSFVYGTLKRGQPNHYRLGKEFGASLFIGTARSIQQFPLVIASKYNIPFLLYAAGKGKVIYLKRMSLSVCVCV